jgi:uncharacterized membrane protein YozB (DUF420 family)
MEILKIIWRANYMMKKNAVIAALILVMLFLIINRRSSGLCTMNAMGVTTCTADAPATRKARR